jgi:hypothetical protein
MPRIGADGRDRGAFAILYALVVVVLVALSAIVVDIASLRQDRRDNRAAADSAVLGAAEFLNELLPGGRQPDKACLRAWDYLVAEIEGLSKPAGVCSAFSPGPPASINPLTYCSSATPAMIRDEHTVGRWTVVVAWPVPRDDGATAADESENFLDPDLTPGDTATQVFDADVDGSAKGCDRIGVAVLEDHEFGLASGIGMGAEGQRTSSHSVAWFNKDGGPVDKVAALNVLNPTDCESLVTTGNGKVVVGPTVENSVVIGPGIIAVESDGKGTCGGNGRAINPTTGAGSLICASSVILNGFGTNCDGLGVIESYALGTSGDPTHAYNEAAVAGGNLKPEPTESELQNRWNPVTKLFGCYTTLTPCTPPTPPTPNYISDYVNAVKLSGVPGVYGSSQSPYSNPYSAPFVTAPTSGANNVCPGGAGITTTIVLAPGNWYIPCALEIAGNGALIIQGGNIVVEGAVVTKSGSPRNGCLVINVPTATTCPLAGTIQGAGTAQARPADPQPAADATLMIRGNSCVGAACGLNHAGDLVMPNTFVYAANAAKELDVGSTGLTLWTAPGAGLVNPSTNRTMLEELCWEDSDPDPTEHAINRDCMNSRFSRLVYWSDYAAPKTKPDNFAGQGSLNVVGVFFTPKAYFNFTGGGSYRAAFAQFWSDSLNVNGGAFLGLAPDARTAIESPTGAIRLIR